ncbi:hypothetical protein F511_35498 [Dorcoceras hygrometricum]|uniref:Secreted protein n=1 Tax=Dorcoceras hygrometricum TaxID=472368 RepID=A0A2Z7BQY0_9LAMI|nr:hypothetical protein F511_35498 [Dorcoceras hygrometricum]
MHGRGCCLWHSLQTVVPPSLGALVPCCCGLCWPCDLCCCGVRVDAQLANLWLVCFIDYLGSGSAIVCQHVAPEEFGPQKNSLRRLHRRLSPGGLLELPLQLIFVSHVNLAILDREHCDVLSMQIDSDLVIYRTTLVRTFQVELSVIPRGSWGDVARRFTMIRWVSPKLWFQSHKCCEPTASCIPEPLRVTQENDNRLPLKCRFPRELFGARRLDASKGAASTAPAGRRPFASRTVARYTAAPSGRRPCAHVVHGGARHHRPTCTNWSRRWPPPCAHSAHGVRRRDCTRPGDGAPPVRRLRGGEATTVFDF